MLLRLAAAANRFILPGYPLFFHRRGGRPARRGFMILNFFSSRPNHPLGDAKEVKRVLAELPLDPVKAVDEIFGWFESLRLADDFRLDHLFDVVSRLDESAQQHLRRLSRDYLQPARLSKSEERRLWTLCYNYWGEVAGLYARCLDGGRQSGSDKGGEALKKASKRPVHT